MSIIQLRMTLHGNGSKHPLNDLPGGSQYPSWCKVYHIVFFTPRVEPTWHYLIIDLHLHNLEPGDILVLDSPTGWLSYATVSCTDPGVQISRTGTTSLSMTTDGIDVFFRKRVKLHEIPISRLRITGQSVLTVVRPMSRANTLSRAYSLISAREGIEAFCLSTQSILQCVHIQGWL